jgi:nitrogen fixation NifU-like protein
MYTETVMDHFQHPRNLGELEAPDGVGEVGSPACGDTMRVTIRVRDGRLVAMKWKTLGCAAAIATSSMTSELARGKTLAELSALTRDEVAAALGGLPEAKLHCSALAVDGLQAAIADYQRRTAPHG